MKPNHLIICLGLAVLLVLSINLCLFYGLNSLNKGRIEVEEKAPQKVAPTTTILFVGDIMLDRGVEYQMEKKGDFYPLEKIEQFLEGFALVFGNLEGPIVKEPPYFPDESLRFAFKKEVAPVLAEASFTLLSLANNHAENMGEEGLEETRSILKEAEIDFVGEPNGCGLDFSFKKENVMIFAFNKTFPFNCSDETLANIVKQQRLQNPDDFLTVSLHWGEEYQLQSSVLQQNLAHKIIDEGADLIIGSHPHVVQEIEEYKGKLIFYSLGNFIFDQYFSKETQQGLIVGIELYGQKVVYRLFPIQSELSQPFLMPQPEAKRFLEKLARKSSSELADKIKKGIIETQETQYKDIKRMIQEYRFGKIIIDGNTYTRDVEVRWDGEILEWQRKESHIVDEGDIERALGESPEVIVIGTGNSGIAQVTDRAREIIEERGVKLIIDKTGEAVRTFNIINEESEEEEGVRARVIGLFHLTC